MARYAFSGHIVHTSGDGTLLGTLFDVDRLEVAGASRVLVEGVQVNLGSASQFALSETGVLIYRPGVEVGGGVPVWVGRDGSEEVLDPTLTGFFATPAISPDGSKIAFGHAPVGSTTDIWIYDLDQETLSRLTFEGQNMQPFWSPDGGEVGFSSNREGPSALYARPADLSDEARLLVAPEGTGVFDALWTPDGRWLVYRRSNSATTAGLLYAAPHPDSTPSVLLDSSFGEDNPSLSPDGRWLVYTSNESDQWEVYVRPFPASGGRSQVSVDGGQNPVWAHSGSEIFYIDSDGFLTVATVRTDPDFAVESREQLTSWTPYAIEIPSRHYDLSPDDRRLLAVKGPAEVGATREIVVQNFFQELRQVLPN